ncbi:Carboxylesterase 1E [Habropoda laboriosa]|uniref:Carboxylesterase 1E n=1 Tax=Habropoda laboriosa TaxID=597456 RepID=A0A0L7QZ77_9HYME|nr:PREDICTED: esterase FE4-like [Habropoda laboriosa]KOC63925.1 Carboxylesterase 1E [Habropoda laboriosa]
MYRRVCLLLLIIFYISTTVTLHTLKRQKRIVGGKPAAPPPVNDPVVYVTSSKSQARIYGTRDPNKGFYVFRGIRFGLPPVGQRRFQRPIPLNLEGEINATKWGPPCPQPNDVNGKRIVGSEDCLFLNVFTPMLPDSGDGYPVLIWIHGGGFRRGSACQYELRNIIQKKIVVVSIQYRLGSLGFLSSGTKDLPGNNGIFDMMLAVKWVEDYIEFFGGNPKKITPFGHGTGASSAFMLALSKMSRNPFSGLIAMSGSILSHFAIDKNPSSKMQYIASTNGCPSNDTVQMIYCLKQIPVDKLIETDSSLQTMRSVLHGFIYSLSTLLGPGPVIEGNDDGRFLPNLNTKTPEDSLQFEEFPTIPLLTGVMNNEVGGAILGNYKTEIQNDLETFPNFLNDYLIPTLQNTISDFGNKSRFTPDAFRKYFNVFNTGNNSVDISKVAEAMGDSLFNVPAFLTVEHWAKKSEAFLYSFDHKGKRNYGKNFLTGLPIADAKHALDGITSHGDDLGYIFKQNTITGEALQNTEESNKEDELVEDIFTNMIAQFAKNGKPNVTFPFQGGSLLPNLLPRFSSESNQFISITATPYILKQFRYCEMGLWTGLAKRLQSPMCNFFKITTDNVEHNAKKIETNVKNRISTFEKTVTDFVPNFTILKNETKMGATNNSVKNTKPTRTGSIFWN